MRRHEFVGGMAFGHVGWPTMDWRASWPLARLTLDDAGLTVSIRGRLLRWLTKQFVGEPTVEIPYDEVVRIERLRWGIRFRTRTEEAPERDRRDCTVFWWLPFQRRAVLAALGQHGLTVSEE